MATIRKRVGGRADTSAIQNLDIAVISEGDSSKYRNDIVLWLIGILFICVIHAGITILGYNKGWNALSGYTHNVTSTSIERFLPEPYIPESGVYKRSDMHASDRWYYWKLKPSLVTITTKASVWSCYWLHILSAWLVLYLQQRSKSVWSKVKQAETVKYSSSPDRYNWMLFGINALFHIIHLVNTHTTYDGLAADVTEASSQSSVMVALLLIIFIEFRERGILFGYPTKAQLSRYLPDVWKSPIYLIRKYHGYFIYWAAIYTFWYHPMENTAGHVFGFTHTWFMMLQGSLAYQHFHLNMYWRLLVEWWVAVHATVTAYQTVPDIMGKELWPQFFFGLSALLAFTHIHGLPVWKTLPRWCRLVPALIFGLALVTAYRIIKDVNGNPYTRVYDFIRVPSLFYMMFIVGYLVIVSSVKLKIMLRNQDEQRKPKEKPSRRRELLTLSAVLLCYGLAVFISWIVEYLDFKVHFLIITFSLNLFFLILPAICGSLLLDSLL